MGLERGQTILLTHETSSWRLWETPFSAGGILGERRLNPAYYISPNVNVLGAVVYIWRASWAWWFLWPCMTNISPLLPATISCLLFWRFVWAPFSGDKETWCFQQPLQLGSLLPSFPAVTHPWDLPSPSSHVLCHICQLPASGHHSNASAFPYPSTIVSSVPEDSRTRITFKWSLVQNKKLVLRRTTSMGTSPGSRRLGVASRRGTKVIVRDHGEEDRFSSWYLSGACSGCCLGFGLCILTNILTVQRSAHCIPLS